MERFAVESARGDEVEELSQGATLSPPPEAPPGECTIVRRRETGIDHMLSSASKCVYDLLQLAPGTMESRLFRFSTPGVEVNGATCSLPFRSSGKTYADVACVTWILDCPGRASMNGRPLEPGLVLVWRPRSDYDGQMPAGFRWVTLQAEWGAISPAAAELGRRWPWRTSLLSARTSEGQARRIARLLRDMGAWSRAGSEEFEPAVGRELGSSWLELAAEAFLNAAPLPAPKGRAWRATLNVRAAERYLRARVGGPVYMKDLCRTLGLSERTLQDSFRTALGMAPMAFLEMLRLHGVYRTLRTPGASSVAEVARRYGLTHGSRLASRFRAVFGQNPRETLLSARRRDGADPAGSPSS